MRETTMRATPIEPPPVEPPPVEPPPVEPPPERVPVPPPGGAARGVAEAVRGAALVGAAVGAAAEAVRGAKQLASGEVDGVRYVGRVLYTASTAGSTTAAKATAAVVLRETVKAVAKRLGAEALRRAASTGPATAIAFCGVNQALDTGRLLRRRIDRREYAKRTTENVGATGGGLGGAAAGALIGSVLPGPGTALGALVGGIAGGIAGARSGRALGEIIFDE